MGKNTEPIPFDDIREFFADEDSYGQLCDIAVPDAKRESWARFLKHIVPQWPYRLTLTSVDGEETPQAVPDDPMDLLLLANSETGPWPGMSLQVGGLDVRVHFFDPDYLEPDFWRREVTEPSYTAIIELMRQMGDAMGNDIFLTAEMQEVQGEIVYEAALRQFRRPRRGKGDDRGIRSQVLAAFDDALRPLRAFIEELEQRGGRHEGALPDALIVPILQQVETILSGHSELTLQDALSVEERYWLKNVWTSLATVAQRADSPIDWQYLLKVVRMRM